MDATLFSLKKVAQLFQLEGPWVLEDLIARDKDIEKLITKDLKGAVAIRSADLPILGRTLFKRSKVVENNHGKCLTFFTTKGGVLKSTLCFNLARLAALEGQKVLVLGLDIQGDISNALGVGHYSEEDVSLLEVDRLLGEIKGLGEYYFGNRELEDLIVKTDLEGLDCIPEVPELALIPEHLSQRNRREYWLREHVIGKLKNRYDFIFIDCSPNWTALTTNALVATDLLISPIETKVNNFRNFQVYLGMLQKFTKEMGLGFPTLFVGTKHQSQRKLAREIKDWYESKLDKNFIGQIRESSIGEEAMALGISLLEHRPDCPLADDYRLVWARIKQTLEQLSESRASFDGMEPLLSQKEWDGTNQRLN